MSQAKYRQGTSASADKHRDLIPRTGMGGGAVFVESASKFLQSNGKILAPVIVLVIVGIFVWWFTHNIQGESSDKLRKQIDAAARKPSSPHSKTNSKPHSPTSKKTATRSCSLTRSTGGPRAPANFSPSRTRPKNWRARSNSVTRTLKSTQTPKD